MKPRKVLYSCLMFSVFLCAVALGYKYVYNPFSLVWGERTIMIKQEARWIGKDVYLNLYDYKTGRSSAPWPGAKMTALGNGIFQAKVSRHLKKPAFIFSYHRRDIARVMVKDNIDACYLQEYGRWVTGDCEIKPMAPFARVVGFDKYIYQDGISVYLQRDLTGHGYYTLDGSDPRTSKQRKSFSYNEKVLLPDVEVGKELVIRLFAANQLGEVDVVKKLLRKIPGQGCYPHAYQAAKNKLSDEQRRRFEELRIYQIFVPTFIDGNPDRGYKQGWGPGPHSGDLEGVLESLDYIASLNMNAIWISPIFNSANDEGGHEKNNATGYYPKYFFDVDRNFGTRQLLKRVVDKAHQLGLYVFFDGIVHHHKNLYGAEPPLSPCGRQLPAGEDHTLPYPESMDYFKEYLVYWIEELGIDGWRTDKAFPLKRKDWAELRAAVENITEKREKRGERWGTLGYMVAESFEGSPSNINEQVYGNGMEPGMFSAFDFPTRYSLIQILAEAENITEMNGRVGPQPAYLLDSDYGVAGHYLYGVNAVPNLMIGNHDLVRFGDLLERAGKAKYGDDQYWRRHALAFAFMAAYTGAITVFYGEEIGLQVEGFAREINDPHCRSAFCDLHVSRVAHRIEGINNYFWKKPTVLSEGEKWLIQQLQQYMKLRNEYPALSHGKRTHLFSSDTIYADLKSYRQQKIIFIMNTAVKGIWVELDLATIGEDKIQDLQNFEVVKIENGKARIWVDGLQARILKAVR